MLIFRKIHATVLLFILTQNFVFASLDNENTRTKILAEMMVASLEVPWIERIAPISRNSESSCADEITALIEASQSRQTWALQMLDASSKLQSGIMSGNLRDLGMYDQCVGIRGQYNDTNIQGKYCQVSYSILSSAICVPSSCNETDLIEFIETVLQNVTNITNPEIEMREVSCVPLDIEDFTAGEIVTICFFSTVGAFIIFCTICELVGKHKSLSPIIRQLSKFSLYTNAISLLSTQVSPQLMPAIQGMRFLSMCWVILGHRYLTGLSRPMINSLEILDWYDTWTAVYVQAAPFAVDTFFVISGFLMTYFSLKSMQSGKKPNYPMMYIHRYLRLTPCIAVLMLFVAVLLHRLGNGPLWNYVLNSYVNRCRKNWWVNLIYVQNFVNLNEMCLMHSWYLAVDMQLFWISPIILYPLHRWPKWGLRILCLLLLGSVITPAVMVAIYDYGNAVVRLDVPIDEMLVNFYHFYIPTYNRACAYFVGILLGYDTATRKRRFSPMNVRINWTVTGILLLVCGLATQRVYNTAFDYDPILETVFAILLRPFWSVAIAWIVYACTYGYGGPIASFLSLPIFLPLSRLSYCMYLVHMVIQATKVGMTQTSGRFSNFNMLTYFWGDLVMSIVVAFIFSLFFESPVIVLEKILTSPGIKRNENRKPKTDVEDGIDNKGIEAEA